MPTLDREVLHSCDSTKSVLECESFVIAGLNLVDAVPKSSAGEDKIVGVWLSRKLIPPGLETEKTRIAIAS